MRVGEEELDGLRVYLSETNDREGEFPVVDHYCCAFDVGLYN
jgi:hypothetical protein